MLNGIRYLARTGYRWRMLPINFPPWQTVYWWFRRFVRLFLSRTIHDLALMVDRERAGREASPSGGILNSQSVKAPAAGVERSFGWMTRWRRLVRDCEARIDMSEAMIHVDGWSSAPTYQPLTFSNGHLAVALGCGGRHV